MSGVGSAHQLQIQQKKTVSQHATECTESRHRYAMRGEHRLRGISEAVRSRPMRGVVESPDKTGRRNAGPVHGGYIS